MDNINDEIAADDSILNPINKQTEIPNLVKNLQDSIANSKVQVSIFIQFEFFFDL